MDSLLPTQEDTDGGTTEPVAVEGRGHSIGPPLSNARTRQWGSDPYSIRTRSSTRSRPPHASVGSEASQFVAGLQRLSMCGGSVIVNCARQHTYGQYSECSLEL